MATLQPPPVASITPSASPKRKRDQLSLDDGPQTPSLQYSTSEFSFEPHVAEGDDGNGSPRSRVARKFQGLALDAAAAGESGAGSQLAPSSTNTLATGAPSVTAIPSLESRNVRHDRTATGKDDDGPTARKRLKLPNASGAAPRRKLPGAAAQPAACHHAHSTTTFAPVLDDDSSPSVKVGNPAAGDARADHDGTDGAGPTIVDPARAALTWHEDEITIYDPNDEDDDGVGINGIGFRPTPAVALARTMKRRQQLVEYRKREEREARAWRTLRRRTNQRTGQAAAEAPSDGGPVSSTSPPELPPRRVRFTDIEPTVVITT